MYHRIVALLLGFLYLDRDAGKEEVIKVEPWTHIESRWTSKSSDSFFPFRNVVFPSEQEEQESSDIFGQVFTLVDIYCLQDVFGLRINY